MRDPIHASLPDRYREACISLFEIPMDESRIFVCRTWTTKPYGSVGYLPTPACFTMSAERVDSARIVAQCVRGILDYIYLDSISGAITQEEIGAIISTVRRRVNLLDIERGQNLFSDIGVPVFYPGDGDLSEALVMPLVEIVGFDPEKIELMRLWTPNKW